MTAMRPAKAMGSTGWRRSGACRRPEQKKLSEGNQRARSLNLGERLLGVRREPPPLRHWRLRRSFQPTWFCFSGMKPIRRSPQSLP